MLTFRMYQTIRFNRPLKKDDDAEYICPGGYEISVKDEDGNDRHVQFDFEDFEGNIDEKDPRLLHVMQKNPDYDTFPDLKSLTKEMLRNVTAVGEWYIHLEGDEPFSVEEVTDVTFVFPYDDWEEIPMDESVRKSIQVTTN